MGQSVGIFFLTSQIGYPLNLIVYSKTGLKTQQRQKIFCFIKTDYHIMQVKSIAECSQGAFCNTFYLHLALICLNDLCLCISLSGHFRQVLLHSPTICNKLNTQFAKITLFILDNSLTLQ